MTELQLTTDFDAYHPGDNAQVTLGWQSDEPIESLELRLVWNTTGKGDRDLSIPQTVTFPAPSLSGSQTTTVQLPWGPYSFSGKLISLIWAFELIALPSEDSIRQEIVIGPDAREVLIGPVDDPWKTGT
jgi:hypothetical protein